MAKTKTNNRRSLTMPMQETTLAALRDAELENGNKPIYQQQASGSRERDRTTRRNESLSTIPLRPETPASPTSPGLPNPLYHASPASTPPRQGSKEQFKSIFKNSNAAKSGTKISAESSVRPVTREASQERKLTKTKSTPDFRAAAINEPVPDLPSIDDGSDYSQTLPHSQTSHHIPRRAVPANLLLSQQRNTTTPSYGPISPIDKHPPGNKSAFRDLFNRKNSNRSDEIGGISKPSTPVTSRAPNGGNFPKPQSRDPSTGRNPSPLQETDEALMPPPNVPLRDQRSQSFRSDGAGSNILNNLRKGAKKAATGINSGANKLFSGSSHHSQQKISPTGPAKHEVIDDYEPVYLNLTLVEQTRVTRIAKRLEDSKDKTEFWMPALPWRCIDYLNFNGCEVEGLYRIPGGKREIEYWWQRFDREFDVNLFEVEDLYDVNVIGSLFKRWCRSLPAPILDEDIQKALDAKYEDGLRAPEELKEVLAKLPPWNYYLLFAITCHLSLLNAYEEKNKMTISNLHICIGQSLKLSPKCFYWLVGDWRSCWTGCTTEKDALEQEYRILAGKSGPSSEARKPSFSSVGSGGSATLISDGEQRYHVQETRGQGSKQMTTRRKENRPPRLSPGRSKDDGHLPATQDSQQHNIAPLSPVHNRSNSHIPELNLPGKMSPLFAPDASE